ncbi:MAG: NRDE family protein [Phycisphaeraceae bacterium]|nr:NRDE family protein [Phycisphaeraceae bacterium]MCW5763806.1 NRDE family protein [Phycisphaeraceae bacterium]
MCTVSIIPISGGVRLVTNRDEKRVRPEAEFPRHFGPGDLAVGPLDTAAGGTWVAARPGLILCLLNMKTATPPPPPEPSLALSRGTIIPDLIGAEGIDEAYETLARLDLPRMLPFRLLGVEVGPNHTRTAIARWDGAALEAPMDAVASPPLALASSGLGDALVQRRLPQFAAMLEASGPTPAMQDAFHRFRWPEADHTSVLMSRPDARTVSITEALVTARSATMHYRVVRDGGVIEEASTASAANHPRSAGAAPRGVAGPLH